MAKSRVRLFNQFRSHKSDSAESATIARDRTQLFNQLTLLFLTLSPIVVICYLLIFLFPNSPINPLRPIAQAVQSTPAPTWTPTTPATPTRTPHPTNTPLNTHTPSPTPTDTETPLPTNTSAPAGRKTTPVKPTRTATPQPTVPGTPTATQSPYNYVADLNYQRSQLYGINWAGVAGLVIGLSGERQSNIDVHVWGDPPLGSDGQIVPSDTAPQYGPSGWEVKFADKLVFGNWHVQLVNSDGSPLSPIVDIEMRGDPRGNLAYVIFTQNH